MRTTPGFFGPNAPAVAVKAKDEITLDFRLVPAAGGPTPKAADTLKAKAKHDGEDVLTPLVERAAAAVLSGAKGD